MISPLSGLLPPLLLIAAVAAAPPDSERAPSIPWRQDFAAAREEATRTGKDILVLVTGSDWCTWCQRLEAEVLGDRKFARAATERFVFVLLDFPRSEAARRRVEDPARSERLRQRFGIDGFPTIVLATPAGRPYARTGYRPGGAAAYLTHLERLQRTGDTLRAGESATRPAPTRERLIACLRLLDEQGFLTDPAHRALIESARSLDPEGLLGFRASFERQREEERLRALYGNGREPRWSELATLLLESRHLRGRRLIGPAFECAHWLRRQRRSAEAQRLYERLREEPLIRADTRALESLEELIQRCERESRPHRQR